MGSGGTVAAEFAAQLGIRVAAIERERVGGDCLWTGCVPSKALLAAARSAQSMRDAGDFGIAPAQPEIARARVWARIRALQDHIADTSDSPERFRDLGVDLRSGAARLRGAHEVEVGGEILSTRYVLLCTGSRPAVPDLPGLAEGGYLTSETVWELPAPPESIVVIGGGPIALELSQALARLGVRTTTLARADEVLPRDEPDLAARLAGILRAEGVDLRTGTEAERVSVKDGRKVVHSGEESFAAVEVFVAAGREPVLDGLELAAAGVRTGPKGVEVDSRLRTSVRSIYACGDVAGRYLFTHSAGFEAARAVRNMFFPWRDRGDYAVPWCTFTDPELAHAGLTEAEARERWGEDVEVHTHELEDSDRALADVATAGAIRVITRKGKVVGGHVLAPGGGEVIHELALACSRGLKLADLGDSIHVYPTISLGIQELAAQAAFAQARRLSWLVRSHAG